MIVIYFFHSSWPVFKSINLRTPLFNLKSDLGTMSQNQEGLNSLPFFQSSQCRRLPVQFITCPPAPLERMILLISKLIMDRFSRFEVRNEVNSLSTELEKKKGMEKIELM